MQRLLSDANLDLLQQADLLIRLIDAAKCPDLLLSYRHRIRQLCEQMTADAQRNIDDLSLGIPGTYEAILSNTQAVAGYLDLVGSRFTGPILRARAEDELMLSVLAWLHAAHPKTAAHPFAFGDGGFSVYNDLKFPAVYFLPASRQATLLYIPLFFHEFGHVLYRFHKPEMDELVKEFQQVVAAHAAPATIRDRRFAGAGDDFRTRLVMAWYPWAQEFFCDAIGLTMTGPAYLHAFSHYLRLRSKEQYYRSRREQLDGRHPVTWLRIRILADRARAIGLIQEADEMEADWEACAQLMKVAEDYEGTWSDDFLVPLRHMLSDMIVEANPRTWNAVLTEGSLTPPMLCAEAWNEFNRAPEFYAAWEAARLASIRSSSKGDPFTQDD
jgi:hypothetical protein